MGCGNSIEQDNSLPTVDGESEGQGVEEAPDGQEEAIEGADGQTTEFGVNGGTNAQAEIAANPDAVTDGQTDGLEVNPEGGTEPEVAAEAEAGVEEGDETLSVAEGATKETGKQDGKIGKQQPMVKNQSGKFKQKVMTPKLMPKLKPKTKSKAKKVKKSSKSQKQVTSKKVKAKGKKAKMSKSKSMAKTSAKKAAKKSFIGSASKDSSAITQVNVSKTRPEGNKNKKTKKPKSCDTKQKKKSADSFQTKRPKSADQLSSTSSVQKSTSARAPSNQIITKPTPPTLRMRQPFKILTDIWGVLTSYTFRQELFAYYDAHCKSFLLTHFEDEDVKGYVKELAKQTAEQRDKWLDMPPVLIVSAPEDSKQTDEATNNKSQDSISKEAIVDSIMLNLTYRNTHQTDKDSLMKDNYVIYDLVWNDGYRNGTLRPHVFPDVLSNFRKWVSDPLYIKIYTFATGPSEIQKLFLSLSVSGNVSEFVTSYFNAYHTFKYSAERFRQVVSSLSERDPANLFYLTDSPRKGEAAHKAGLSVFIVTREGNKQYKPEQLAKFNVIDSFDQFYFYQFQ